MNLVLKQIQKDMNDFFADMDKAIGKKPIKLVGKWKHNNLPDMNFGVVGKRFNKKDK